MGKVMTRHIPQVHKEKGEITKKNEVDGIMPLEFFQGYMKNIVFALKKVLASYGTMYATNAHYAMALNIQDPNTNVGYDFIEYIITKIRDELVATQEGNLDNFRFFHYSMLMHLILFRKM